MVLICEKDLYRGGILGCCLVGNASTFGVTLNLCMGAQISEEGTNQLVPPFKDLLVRALSGEASKRNGCGFYKLDTNLHIVP